MGERRAERWQLLKQWRVHGHASCYFLWSILNIPIENAGGTVAGQSWGAGGGVSSFLDGNPPSPPLPRSPFTKVRASLSQGPGEKRSGLWD